MERAGNERLGNQNLVLPVKEKEELVQGTMAAIDGDGYVCKASATEGLVGVGCIMRYCDNSSGASGDKTVLVRRGVFVWNNDGTIAITDVLKKCYIKDEQTVTLDAEGSSVAGTILGVDLDGVIVEMMNNRDGQDGAAATE